MKPLKGIVTDVLNGLWIKLENGPSVHYPHRMGLKIGSKVMVFYDFTRRKVKTAVGVKDFSSIDKLSESEEIEDPGDINHNYLFEEDERKTVVSPSPGNESIRSGQ